MKAKENRRRFWWLTKILLWLNIFNSLFLIGAYLNTHISPNSVSYLSLLGLAFPILLSIAIVFMLVWFFVRRKFILISALTIVLGWSHLHHFYAVTLWQTELNDPIKVLSYNVHVFDLWDLENREKNRDEIFEFLENEDVDILCLQEFYHQDEPSDFVTKNKMIEMLGTNYYHERYTHEMTGKKYFGVATFSKYPIVHQGEISFENDPNNFCIYSDVVIESETLRVFNAHLGSIRLQTDDYSFFGDPNGPEYPEQKDLGQQIIQRLLRAFEKRAIQAELVAAEIENSPHPVVLCGDLNDTPVSYCYRQFNRLLNDAFVECGNGIGQTYIGKVPSNRIDYIFLDEAFKSSNFTTHQINLSDHKPISVQIELDID